MSPIIVSRLLVLTIVLSGVLAHAPAAAATDAVAIAEGHVDLGARIVDGQLQLLVKDGTHGTTPVWREPAQTTLEVRPAAKAQLPASGRLAFLGAPGDPVWLIPQVEQAGVLWAGWNTEEIDPGQVAGAVTWTLEAAEGPGAVAIFQTGTFGAIDVLLNSRDGLPDSRAIPLGTHAHGSWAFTAPGTYRLTFAMRATAPGGGALGDRETLTVVVHDQVPASPPPGDQDPAPVLPSRPGAAPGRPLTLALTAARLRGRALTLALRVNRSSRVVVTVRRRGSVVASASARTVDASSRRLRLRLGRRLAPGRYVVRVQARDGARTLTRTIRMRVAGTPVLSAANGARGQAGAARSSAAASASGPVVLAAGHVDWAARIVSGRLQALVKDGTRGAGAVVWREPGDVVFALGAAARVALPEGTGLDSLGRAGDRVWLIPQVQREDVLWAGWNTEAIDAGQVSGAIVWRLAAVDGPGAVAIFQTGSFGDADVLFDSADGLPDAHAIPLGTHAHGNWAFTQPGVYRLRFELSARAASGERLRDVERLTVAVGDAGAAVVEPGAGGDDAGRSSGSGADGDGETGPGSGGDPGASAGAGDAGAAAAGDADDPESLPLTGWPLGLQAGGGVLLLVLGALLRRGLRLRTVSGGLAALALLLALAGCGTARDAQDRGAHDRDAALRVVTTTEILADLVRNVGGERVQVSSLVPAGGDPHSYEPTPADAVRVSEADVTFTNHLLLEEHALIKAIDANAREDAPNVSLAEASETYGAHVMPLVEDVGLDVIWLGLRVRGDGAARGATRASDVRLSATALDGPGELVVYLTEALGRPEVYYDSADGFDRRDLAILPPAAHTHLNWAFTKPGVYRLTLQAALDDGHGRPRRLGQGTFAFAVGVDPRTARRATVLGDGHTDLTVDLDSGELYAFSDANEVGAEQRTVPAREVVIEVPNRALASVPEDRRFAFLGVPGARIFQLPQAVLGKHVHGEIDPHLWQDVRNAAAYAQLIRDTLGRTDPAGADAYRAHAAAYLRTLDRLDGWVRQQIAAIPPGRRQLVTTHDAFGYLADAYDMTVAGFVVPNPAQEPSVEQVQTLTETIANLRVPAVFMEPNLAQRATVLRQVAEDQGVAVCKLYGDAFDAQARSYIAMMRHNAGELRRCLA
jgi:anchored repeat ABC transporter substrate-binding protein